MSIFSSRERKRLLLILLATVSVAVVLAFVVVLPPKPRGAVPAPLGASARARIDEPVDESKRAKDPKELARQLREFEADQKRRANQPELDPSPPTADLGAIPLDPGPR